MRGLLIALALAGCGTPGDETGKGESPWGDRIPCTAEMEALVLEAPESGGIPYVVACYPTDDRLGCVPQAVYLDSSTGAADFSAATVYCPREDASIFVAWLH